MRVLTTPSSIPNISFVSSFKILQIDKFPDPPFPISFSIRKSNPKFKTKNPGIFSNPIFFCFIIHKLFPSELKPK